MSKSVQRSLGFLLLFASLTGSASARDVEVRWIPPTSDGVAGYRLYIGVSRVGIIEAAPIDLGRPSVDASGVASARIAGLDRSMLLGFEMTAYDALGRESVRSNFLILDSSGGEAFGASLWSADFDASPLGFIPDGFLAPTGTFRVSEFPDGNRALAGQTLTGLVSAQYIGSDSLGWGDYEISGRLMLQLRTSVLGIAVRADTNLGSYFGLGGDGSGEFALSQQGKAPLTCARSQSTGQGVDVTTWFRFRLRVTRPSGRSRLRAKFWTVGQAEPLVWGADCWTTVALPLGSGELALYTASRGRAYWDKLLVRSVIGVIEPIPDP